MSDEQAKFLFYVYASFNNQLTEAGSSVTQELLRGQIHAVLDELRKNGYSISVQAQQIPPGPAPRHVTVHVFLVKDGELLAGDEIKIDLHRAAIRSARLADSKEKKNLSKTAPQALRLFEKLCTAVGRIFEAAKNGDAGEALAMQEKENLRQALLEIKNLGWRVDRHISVEQETGGVKVVMLFTLLPPQAQNQTPYAAKELRTFLTEREFELVVASVDEPIREEPLALPPPREKLLSEEENLKFWKELGLQ